MRVFLYALCLLLWATLPGDAQFGQFVQGAVSSGPSTTPSFVRACPGADNQSGTTISSGTCTAVATGNTAIYYFLYCCSTGQTHYTVTDNAGSPNTYTEIGNSYDTGIGVGCQWGYLTNISGNPTQLHASGTGLSFSRFGYDEFHNIASGAALDGSAGVSLPTFDPGATTNALGLWQNSQSIATSQSNDLLYGAVLFLNGAPGSWTAGTSGTTGGGTTNASFTAASNVVAGAVDPIASQYAVQATSASNLDTASTQGAATKSNICIFGGAFKASP